MDRYKCYCDFGIETHDADFEENKNGSWYKADEVADLARRVLPFMKSGPINRIACDYPEYRKAIAELEQIAGK